MGKYARCESLYRTEVSIMKNIEILDRHFNRLCWMSNESEQGLHFYADKLTTSIDSGVYTLEFRVPKRIADVKRNKKMSYLKENNFIRFRNRQDVSILMTINNIVEDGDEKHVYAEDVTISLINSLIDTMETPQEPQSIEYYLIPALNKTGISLGINESDEKRILELNGYQNALERIREVVQAFGMEFYFRVEFLNSQYPKFYIHLVKQRLEGRAGFRISTDDVVGGIERTINTDNIITKLLVRGRMVEEETEEAENKPEEVVNSGIEQVITIARQQLGKPYVWGANGPNSFDCSGFVTYSCRQANYTGYPTTGRPTTHSIWSGIHASYFNKVSRSDLKRGDLILYDTGYTYPGDANHIGIYLGNDQVIHAGNPVQIQGAHSMKVVGYVRVKGG